jgi:hypothetical protein
MIPEGFYALVTSHEAEVSHENGSCVWPSGIAVASPFTKIAHLITKQFVVFDAPVKGCKTADNVTVQIDVSVVFRIMGDAKRGEDPELVRQFVHRVTPAGLEQQLQDALAEEIRTLARSLKHTEVWACRSPLLAQPVVDCAEHQMGEEELMRVARAQAQASPPKAGRPDPCPGRDAGALEAAMTGTAVTVAMKGALNAQFQRQGVEIADITIQDVILPRGIAQQMEGKTLVRSKQDYEVMEQQFDMQAIRLQNDIDRIKLRHKEEQESEKLGGQRIAQAARDKLLERTAERERELKDFEAQTVSCVSKIRAEGEEITTKLRHEQDSVLQTMRLEAEEISSRLKADTAAQIQSVQAETKLSIAQKRSEAAKILADAEERTNKVLLQARTTELTEKELKVYEALATNPDVVLSDSNEKEFNLMLLADSVLEGARSRGAESHHSILANLNMLRLATCAYGLKGEQPYIPDNSALAG